MELNLEKTNYLRELVGLPAETTTEVSVQSDKRRIKANQIRRAVKRHSQVGTTASKRNSGRPSSTRQGTGNTQKRRTGK